MTSIFVEGMPLLTTTEEETLRNEWKTPDALADAITRRHELILDVAASFENKKCFYFIPKEADALLNPWEHDWWCNPPFDNILAWVEHALRQKTRGVMLLPCRMNSDWMNVVVKSGVCDLQFFRGRVQYEVPDPRIKKSSAGFHSMLIHFNSGGNNILPTLCPKTGVER